jgi:enhancing lycopene biosynthesis protein 2
MINQPITAERRQVMQKVGVVLSGCGVFDGAEINEVVLTLLALEQANLAYQALAPDIAHASVKNHSDHSLEPGSRNVLVEAARIVRGQIQDVASANVDDFSAVIFPGGFGVVQNLCDFLQQGSNMTIQPEVLAFATAMHQAHKPSGYICIAPVLIPRICGAGVKLTVGNNAEIAAAITAMGGQHVLCAVDDIVIDATHKVVSTPAYMLASSISQAQLGIQKLVQQVATWLKNE